MAENDVDMMIEDDAVALAGNNGKPPPVHVPPRIDPDMYQADVPDWCPNQDGTIWLLDIAPVCCCICTLILLLFHRQRRHRAQPREGH